MVSRHSASPLQETPGVRQVQLVGRRLRRLRKERRLGQEELAARVGIQASELARMEKDVYRVSLDVLVRILAVLDVRAEELFAEPPGPSAPGGGPLRASSRAPK
jgi:transcriptional regulator with XRE-family HTH domain